MSDRRRLMFLAVVFISAVLTLAGPARAAENEPLKVLAVFPNGDTPRVKEFTVTFNQPMTALGDMAVAPDQALFTVSPAMAGAYRWLNVYTLAFEPKTPLEGALAGEILVKAGARSMSGQVLDQDVRIKYALPAINILKTSPERKAGGLPLKPEIRLTFNQPLDLNRLKELAYFETAKAVRIKTEVLEDFRVNTGRRLGGDWACLVSPVTELPKDSTFELVLPPGLASQAGPLVSEKTFRLPYRTYGPFRVLDITGFKPEHGVGLDPEGGLEIKFSTAVLIKDIVKHLKITPAYDLKTLEEEESLDNETFVLWLPGPFKAATLYTLAFSPELKDRFGQKLAGRLTWQVGMGPARPILDLPGRQGVIEVSTAPTYPFQARNVNLVQARGRFLYPDQTIPFIMKHELYRYLSESAEDFLKDVPLHEIKTSRIKITAPANVATFQPFKLRDMFGGAVGQGLMYFDLAAKETNDPATGETVYRRALVQMTDLGLSVKFGLNNTLIWTTSLKTGESLGGVRLEIRNAENQTLWRGQSDSSGLALAPGADTLKIMRGGEEFGEPSLFVFAFHQEMFSLVSTEWNQGIAPWEFNLMSRNLDEGPQVLTHVLTALPLYKPGDEVQLKVIQRLATAQGLAGPKDKKILAHVRDSRGRTIEKLELELNRFGTASARFNLSTEASLGHYSVVVGPDVKKLRHSGFFRVEAYRKPTFAVKVEPSVETGLPGDRIEVNLSAAYHFGAPVKGQPAEYIVQARPTGYSLPRFEDYAVEDLTEIIEEAEDQTATVSQGKLELDDSGRAGFNFTAEADRRPRPRSFEIEATVTDVDQRTVSQRAEVLVHPASMYLGLKTDVYLVGPGEKIDFKFLAARPDGAVQPDVPLELTLYRRVWQTVRRKGVGGYYQYVSKATDTVIDRASVKSGPEPLEHSFSVDQGGYYLIAAKGQDEAGRPMASAVDFYAYGPGAAGWEHFDHDRIDIIPDKKEYRPGESAVILVKSPFTQGTGLVTVERHGVRRHQFFKIESASPHVQVKLEKEDGPNVYVSVLLIRGRIADKLDPQGRDVGKPAFKAGYVELKVKDDSRRLLVEVKPDRPEARPGEEIELAVKVADAQGRPLAAEVALIAADAALLQLASDNAYYPERVFHAPAALGVWTVDLRLNLIGRRHYGLKGAKPGGGGGPETEGGERVRRRFVSLALFEPHLVTDASGQARVKFKLPDNLTTFKLFAVAADEADKFGTGQGSLTVTKPLLLTSSLPNFAGVGDTFQAAVSLHNRGEASGKAVVTLAGDNFELIGEGSRTVDVARKSSQEITFPVRIKPGTEAVFRFTAALDQEKDSAEFRLPLRYPNSLITAATYGRLTETVRQSLKLPDDADRNRGALTIVVAPSLTGSLGGAFDYLVEYPHQCLEQKASRALSDLLFLKWRVRLGRPEKAEAEARKRLEKFFIGLPNYQNAEGGFFFWPTTRWPDPYLSAYVVQVLNLARNSGLEVDQRVLNLGRQYIENTVKRDRWPFWYSQRDRLAARTYLVSVLVELGLPVDALVENLYGLRDNMDSFEWALLLRILAQTGRDPNVARQIEDISRKLFNRAVLTSGEVHFEEKVTSRGLMGSLVRTNSYALRALLKTDPDHPHLVALARWLIRSGRDGYWGGTQSSAAALLALTEYIEIMEQNPPDLNLKTILDGQVVAEAFFKSFNDPPLVKQVPVTALEPGRKTPLEFAYQGQGTAYYTLRLAYSPEEPDLTDYQAGLALSRAYTLAEEGGEGTKSASTFQRGDIVRVDVTLLVPHQRHWVVLEDRLPAGLEALNFDLPVAPKHLEGLLRGPSRPDDYYRRYWYEHREIKSDRVAVYARTLIEGVYTFSYLARAVTSGTFIAPGPTAEEMYSPEVSGLGNGTKFEIGAK
ncbi:MAG: MG2 domain-containing protein [Thermodesulfobacteriota bacterium]